jgi:cytochrome c biogenesis protein CcmG/thiol:disulfide interchange protein DsbE
MEVEDKQNEEIQVEKVVTRQHRTRKRRITIFIVVSLLNAGLLALFWSQLLVPAQNQSNVSSTSTQSSSPLDGHPAPDFTTPLLSTHSGSAIHLASLKGKPVVLNFWASWCDPCKQEAPLLQSTWQRIQGQEVAFIGINYEDRQSDGLSFLQTYGITYANVVDRNSNIAIAYGVTGVPETVFIDRHGVVIHKVIGQLNEQTIQSNLQQIVRLR